MPCSPYELCIYVLYVIGIDFFHFSNHCVQRCRVPWSRTHVAVDSSMAEHLIVYRTSLSGSGNHVSLDFLSRQALPRPANRKHPKRTERNVSRYWSDRDDHYTYCIVVSLAPARHPPTHFVTDGRRSLFVHTSEVHNIRATTERL